MKRPAIYFATALVLLSSHLPAAFAQESALAGRWDLTVQNGVAQMPSWLEITYRDGAPQARFVGRWGHARVLPKAEINGDQILFVSPKDEEGSSNDLVFTGSFTGDSLTGTAIGPNQAKWSLNRRPRAASAASGRRKTRRGANAFSTAPILRDGEFDNPKKASSWSVEDGCLVNHSSGANIITQDLRSGMFKLHVEVNCPVKSNSGIYLRGRYEVQIEDDSLDNPPNRRIGSIYGFLAPQPAQPRTPGQWQTFDITLQGRYVTVVQNGVTIIDNQEIPGVTGGALDSHEGLPGPIYLQGDHGGVAYRNLKITPLSP